MTPMEFSGFTKTFASLYFSMWFHTVRKVDQPRGALVISEHRLETGLRYLKFNGTSVDGLELDLNGLRNMQFRMFWMPIVFVT